MNHVSDATYFRDRARKIREAAKLRSSRRNARLLGEIIDDSAFPPPPKQKTSEVIPVAHSTKSPVRTSSTSSELIDGIWKVMRDDEDVWYVHIHTGESVWEIPTSNGTVNGASAAFGAITSRQLSNGWIERSDGEDTWYQNSKTGATCWERPKDA